MLYNCTKWSNYDHYAYYRRHKYSHIGHALSALISISLYFIWHMGSNWPFISINYYYYCYYCIQIDSISLVNWPMRENLAGAHSLEIIWFYQKFKRHLFKISNIILEAGDCKIPTFTRIYGSTIFMPQMSIWKRYAHLNDPRDLVGHFAQCSKSFCGQHCVCLWPKPGAMIAYLKLWH